jgi:Flp pilus assembly protein TadD
MADINAEFLYCSSGRALLMLSDYDQAKRRLIAAQRIEPNNISVSNELKKVCEQKIILKCSSHE